MPARKAAEAVEPRELAIEQRGAVPVSWAAVRPFWKAVFEYGDEVGSDGPEDPLIDPDFQGPAIWFRQTGRDRPQRNRIHFDLCVPHDEAPRRVEAAPAAGGRLPSDRRAPAFWVFADLEGNEVCVTARQGCQE